MKRTLNLHICSFFQFYADDRRDKANVITTHSFGTVVASRYIRIVASTDVRWIGEAEKCFRFEILGTHSSHVFTNPEFSICNSFFFLNWHFDKKYWHFIIVFDSKIKIKIDYKMPI